jgi:hypothetical protein
MYKELLDLHRDKSISLINKSIDYAVAIITNDHAVKETK